MKTYLSSKLKVKGADPAKVINRAIELAKDKTTIVFPDGVFALNSSIQIFNKGVRLEGAEDTQLRFYQPVPGIIANRNAATSRLYINRLNLLNSFNDGDNADQHGIVLSVPTTIEETTIENFHGNGLHMTADVVHRPATDVSFSKIESVRIGGCRRNGIYLQGGDANACLFIHVDIRDNGGYGILDESFLGNCYVACMAHLNKLGNYKAAVDNTNNRSTFIGCYSEEGSPMSEIGGTSMVFGGLWGGGVKLSGYAKAYWNGKVGNYGNEN